MILFARIKVLACSLTKRGDKSFAPCITGALILKDAD